MSAPRLALVHGDVPAGPRTSTGTVRVAIADGQALVRAGFRALLEAEDGIDVVGEAANRDAALELASRTAPDVLLIDSELPGGAVEVTGLLLADPASAATRVLMLAAADDDERVFKALRAGVSGFLLKDTPTADLAAALCSVAAGDAALSPSVARRVVEEVASSPEPDRPAPEDLDELTPREREVVALVAGGLSNREIAERLVVSPATAKTHVSRALRKLAARDRAELVTIAYESGLVVAGPQRRMRSGAPVGVAA